MQVDDNRLGLRFKENGFHQIQSMKEQENIVGKYMAKAVGALILFDWRTAYVLHYQQIYIVSGTSNDLPCFVHVHASERGQLKQGEGA